MGVYYYLDHAKLDESFELNKGPNGWQSLEKSSAWLDRACLLESLMVEMNTGWHLDNGLMAYCLWLRDELWKWHDRFHDRFGDGVKRPPILQNDANTDYVPRKITGSRFAEKYEEGSLTAWFEKHYGAG